MHIYNFLIKKQNSLTCKIFDENAYKIESINNKKNVHLVKILIYV